MKKTAHHPQIYHYLKQYQDDPHSRVFAPLAEAYRKAGLAQEAVEIAEEGLKIHPNFTSGRVAYARALFDLKKYPEVVSELATVVQNAPDNIIAQRLLAESQLMLGNVREALDAFKMLLYFIPQDEETAKLVHELEAQGGREEIVSLENRGTTPRIVARTRSGNGMQSERKNEPASFSSHDAKAFSQSDFKLAPLTDLKDPVVQPSSFRQPTLSHEEREKLSYGQWTMGEGLPLHPSRPMERKSSCLPVQVSDSRHVWGIELLQDLLRRVERYRTLRDFHLLT